MIEVIRKRVWIYNAATNHFLIIENQGQIFNYDCITKFQDRGRKDCCFWLPNLDLSQ